MRLLLGHREATRDHAADYTDKVKLGEKKVSRVYVD